MQYLDRFGLFTLDCTEKNDRWSCIQEWWGWTPHRAAGARVCSSLYQAFMQCQLPESGQYSSKSSISWNLKGKSWVNHILNLQLEIEMNLPSLCYILVAKSPLLDLGPLVSWHQIFLINEKISNLGLIKLYQLYSYCFIPMFIAIGS